MEKTKFDDGRNYTIDLIRVIAAFIAMAGGNLTRGGIIYEVIVVASALIFVPIYRLLIKPLAKLHRWTYRAL